MTRGIKHLIEDRTFALFSYMGAGAIVGILLGIVFWDREDIWRIVILTILGTAIGGLVFFLNLGGFNWSSFWSSLRQLFQRMFWGAVIIIIATLTAILSGLNVLQGSRLPYFLQGVSGIQDSELVIGVILGAATTFIATLAILFAIAVLWRHWQRSSHEFGAKITEFERRAFEAEQQAIKTKQIKPLWEVARYTLEAHFNRNLRQNNYIFWTSATLMFVGFGAILYAVWLGVSNPETIEPAVIAGVGGVITEFIGTICLSVYRSTVEESLRYTTSLERINMIGVTLQILDDTDVLPEEMNKNRTEVAKLLIGQMSAIQ